MDVKVPTVQNIINSNNNGIEAEYLLSHTKTWQQEEEMSSSFTGHYMSSVSYVETIKIEGEENENLQYSVCGESEMITGGKVHLSINKKEDATNDNVHAGESGYEVEHSRKKSFVCDQCVKCFPRKYNLTRHNFFHSSLAHAPW